MFAGRLSLRAFGIGGGSGGGGSASSAGTLEADLRRVTESGVVEVPVELLKAVSEATSTEESRRTVMSHLRECLAEPSARRWRRIHAGLALVEELLKSGAPELLTETAEGRHFDLVQRLSLLELFEFTNDKRVQNMVRSKASAVRAKVVPGLESAGDRVAAAPPKDVPASSPGVASVASCSTVDTQSLRSTSPPRGQMILNGIVAVGHRDDTTSESSGDEAPCGSARPVAFREARRARPVRSSAAAAAPVVAVAPVRAVTAPVDLLEL